MTQVGPSTSRTSPSNRSTIWVGNLDPRVTEFQLLKVVEPFGRVVRFDFMYSNNDRGERLPRGYAFVTYEDYLTADKAIKKLNGVKLMSREMKVQPSSATNIPSKSSSSSLKSASNLPLSMSMNLNEKSKKGSKSASSLSKIRAMEATLMALKQGEDFQLAIPSSSKPSAVHHKKPYDRPS